VTDRKASSHVHAPDAADVPHPKNPARAGSGPETLSSAGTICWRSAKPGSRSNRGAAVEIAVVHRPRHRDWSLPKGKPEPGETLPVCAVRETREETGAEVILGPPLPTQKYRLPDGRAKQVTYWTAQVVRTGPRTAPADEIDEVRWMSPSAAAELLSYNTDRMVLSAFADVHCPGCYPVIVLRHVTARPRDAWPRADADRPLVSSGKRQAKTLADLLACWHPEYLLSSPWKRCVETLQPYQRQSKVKLRTKSGLSEEGARHNPGKAYKHTEKVLNHGAPSALCTHRPVLPRVLDTIRLHSDPRVAEDLPEDDPYLRPGQLLVLHVWLGHDGPHVVAIERHSTPR
jgi:8-oxo-dGTP diphosphatase